MRVVIQRVKEAHVDVAGATVGSIGAGLLVFVGVSPADDPKDAEYLADKITQLRIFPDSERRMNRSLVESGGRAAGSLAIYSVW